MLCLRRVGQPEAQQQSTRQDTDDLGIVTMEPSSVRCKYLSSVFRVSPPQLTENRSSGLSLTDYPNQERSRICRRQRKVAQGGDEEELRLALKVFCTVGQRFLSLEASP